MGILAIPLRQFHLQFLFQSGCGAFQCYQCNRSVIGVEQPFEGGAAGLHTACHFGLGQFAAFHLLRDLIGDHALDGGGLRLLEEVFLLEEIVEFASVLQKTTLRIGLLSPSSLIAE